MADGKVELVQLGGGGGGAARPAYGEMPQVGKGTRVEAVYVHVPFCSTKCDYCDFYSVAGHLGEAEGYLDLMEREAELQLGHFGKALPETIFIGGGTPTLLEAGQLERLLGILRKWLDVSGVVEWTVEANPNTFDGEKARVLAAGGVNRVSFGAQSFLRNELQVLQRDHDPESVATAFAAARAAGIENLNVDLIFGIPGQTVGSWDYSLGRALELGSDHVSCYSLMYEPNTGMTARLKRGEVAAMGEDAELELFEHVYMRLREAGYARYEVSNYARPGKECRHNVHYWKGSNWLALGTAAAGHVAGWRWKNVAGLGHYGEAVRAGILPATGMERLSAERRAAEIATFWLRLVEGLEYAEFKERMGVDARPVLEQVLGEFVEMGLVELSATRAKLTEKAVAVSDAILRKVVGAF